MIKKYRILAISLVLVMFTVLISGCSFTGGIKKGTDDISKSDKVVEEQGKKNEVITSKEDEEPIVKEEVQSTVEDSKTESIENVNDLGVGDTVQLGGLELTVNSVRYDEGNEFTKPEQGKKWLVLDCTFKNIGSESLYASDYMLTLLDSDFYSKETTYTPNLKGNLSGDLGAGRTIRGEVAYEVNSNETNWELIFEPDLFEEGQAIYTILNKNIK